VLEQVEAWLEMLQPIVPAGARAPVIPVTVAVKVIDPPKTGLDGDVVTVIEGVAGRTVTESGEVADSEEKLESPL
jgi:predicted thioesterase